LITGSSDRLSVCREEEAVTVKAYRLMEAHQRIDEELRLESGRRRPDPFKLMRLKKLKLRIKDRLSGLMPKNWGAAR
jgi:uncharacterized protein YdcH (DUF465 family)